jgi:uncharacterized lipoprotein YehR (DUF1307 family)
MKRILVLLLVLVVGVAALGYYRGWFEFSTEHTGQKSNVTFTIDEDKIRKDSEKAKEKVKEAEEAVKEKIGAGTEKAKDKANQP